MPLYTPLNALISSFNIKNRALTTKKMTIISIMLLIAGAALLLAVTIVTICCVSWASFWKSWRKDNDADWE